MSELSSRAVDEILAVDKLFSKMKEKKMFVARATCPRCGMKTLSLAYKSRRAATARCVSPRCDFVVRA